MLLDNCLVTRVVNATVAGTSDLEGTVLDMQGFGEVLFIAAFGTLTSSQVTSLKAQQGDLADGSDMADISGAVAGPMANGDGNKLLLLGLNWFSKRYVR